MPNRHGAPLSEPVVRATQADCPLDRAGSFGVVRWAWYIFTVTKRQYFLFQTYSLTIAASPFVELDFSGNLFY